MESTRRFRRINRVKELFTALAIGSASLGLMLSGCSEPDPAPTCGQPATTDSAQIVITSPGCGSFKVGTPLSVKWNLKGRGNQEITAVDVLLSHNDGQIWTNLRVNSIAPTDPDWGNFSWTVTDSISRLGVKYNLVGNDQCRIKVMQYSTGNLNQVAISGRFTVTR